MLPSSNEEDVIDSEDEEDEDDDTLVHGRRKKKVAFLPSFGKSGCLCFLFLVLRKKIKTLVFCASWSLCIYVFSDVFACVCARRDCGGGADAGVDVGHVSLFPFTFLVGLFNAYPRRY